MLANDLLSCSFSLADVIYISMTSSHSLRALLGKIGSTMDFDGAKDDFNDGGVQLTAFNMDEENEEGYTDEAGNYHEKKPDATEEVRFSLFSLFSQS